MSLPDEEFRILKAANDGRLCVNEHGRYVIDGEKRPDRRVRQRLIQRLWVSWPHYKTRRCDLTEKGRAGLHAEALDREAPRS